MISQENARRLLDALRVKESAETEVETYNRVIKGQQQELANAEGRLAIASDDLNALLDELSISDPPPPSPVIATFPVIPAQAGMPPSEDEHAEHTPGHGKKHK